MNERRGGQEKKITVIKYLNTQKGIFSKTNVYEVSVLEKLEGEGGIIHSYRTIIFQGRARNHREAIKKARELRNQTRK